MISQHQPPQNQVPFTEPDHSPVKTFAKGKTTCLFILKIGLLKNPQTQQDPLPGKVLASSLQKGSDEKVECYLDYKLIAPGSKLLNWASF